MSKKQQFKTGLSWAKSLGKDIEDADEPLEIVLTKGDVTKGIPLDHMACAFARGVCRQEGAVNAWVGLSTAYIEWDDVVWRYAVPQSVARELVSFDRSKISDVGEFRLIPVQPSQRFGAERTRSAKRGPHTTESTTRGKHYTGMVRA